MSFSAEKLSRTIEDLLQQTSRERPSSKLGPPTLAPIEYLYIQSKARDFSLQGVPDAMVKRAMSLNKELRARAREKSEDVTIKEEEAWEPCSTWLRKKEETRVSTAGQEQDGLKGTSNNK